MAVLCYNRLIQTLYEPVQTTGGSVLCRFLSVLICNQPNVGPTCRSGRGTMKTRKSKQSNKHWPTLCCHTFNNNVGSIATRAMLINSWNTLIAYREINPNSSKILHIDFVRDTDNITQHGKKGKIIRSKWGSHIIAVSTKLDSFWGYIPAVPTLYA
jgi:hypothetical protein